MSTINKITFEALNALCDGKEFDSSGFGYVSIGLCSQKAGVLAYKVNGYEVFTLELAGHRGILKWHGFNGFIAGEPCRIAAVEALDFMFEATGMSASAEIVKNEIQVSGKDLRNRLVHFSFPMTRLFEALETEKNRMQEAAIQPRKKMNIR